ncbi:hypothetical protein [Microbispora sp. NPDC049125]|uniref:hypothetical protein n=1 Tax=Microbispora sp. NPDC049125 TaxID=3154929 RepID=UPI00346784F3
MSMWTNQVTWLIDFTRAPNGVTVHIGSRSSQPTIIQAPPGEVRYGNFTWTKDAVRAAVIDLCEKAGLPKPWDGR